MIETKNTNVLKFSSVVERHVSCLTGRYGAW